MDNQNIRLFLALAICLGMFYVYTTFIAPPLPPPKPVATQDKSKDGTGKAATGAEKEAAAKKTPAAKPEKKEKPKPAVVQATAAAGPSQTKTLTTERYHVELSSQGARVAHFYMRNYTQDDREYDYRRSDRVVELEINGNSEKVLEVTEDTGMDLQLFFDRENLFAPELNKSNFSVVEATESKVTFATQIKIQGAPVEYRKTYQVLPGENFIYFDYELKNLSNEPVTIADDSDFFYLNYVNRLGPLNGPKENGKFTQGEFNAIEATNFYNFYLQGEDLETIASISIDGGMAGCGVSEAGSFAPKPVLEDESAALMIGSSSRYIVGSLVLLNNDVSPYVIQKSKRNELGRIAFAFPRLKLAAVGEKKADRKVSFAMFMGLRESDQLKVHNQSFANGVLAGLANTGYGSSTRLEEIQKSFDINSIIAPFRDLVLWILLGLYTVIPNFGWAIIVFAILFKAVFYPLNQKQAESMKKMQAVQPKLKEINKKYANDAQLKQKKIMELYQKEKINPAAGCLPILIQMPIFIALYGAFGGSFSLWGAEFFGWINDLSKPDTITTLNLFDSSFNVNMLPILMAASQILQMKLTPTTGDASQQKIMMYFMPLFMLWIMWEMPAGLTLYWTISNLLTIAQQVYTNNKLEAKEATA